MVDLVDVTIEMQIHAYNEIAHMLPTFIRIPVLLQVHTYKQSLTIFVTSSNLELLYIYGAN